MQYSPPPWSAFLAYTIRFAGILRTTDEDVSRMLGAICSISVLYLPLLSTSLMVCAMQVKKERNKMTHQLPLHPAFDPIG